MRWNRTELIYSLLILTITIIAVFDLFTNSGRSANMDGLTHTTTIGLYYKSLLEDFPVTWTNGFANYGYPLGLIAHQIPSYLGAFINLVTHNPVLSFNIVCFIGLLLSNFFYYFFLRIYFLPIHAFLGTFIFNFAPYRIINLYIRGAIPEAFSNVFLPLILIGIYLLIKKQNVKGFFLLIISIALLTLTHPMNLVIYSFIFFPYLLYVLYEEGGMIKKMISILTVKKAAPFFLALFLGMGIASYYILPLTFEVKYFYYGQLKNHLVEGKYLGINNYFDNNWYYFTKQEIYPRGHVINAGLLETIAVIIGIVYLIFAFIRKDTKIYFLCFAVLTSLSIIFFTTSSSDIFYRNINLLSNIQFPWRMLSAYMFLPPIIIVFLVQRINKMSIVLLLILCFAILRFPQLYGKNYTNFPESMYYFTPNNLHSTVMNTVWSGRTEDYPIKNKQWDIISGEGSVTELNIKNSRRSYEINAQNPVELVDYTFYFPGWKVFVDGIDTAIQYQNPNYRGVITYFVPAGKHMVSIIFEDTKVRKISKIMSLIFIGITVCLFMLRKKVKSLLPNPS